MLQRFKKDRRGSQSRSMPRREPAREENGLPFDLELTRRVTGGDLPCRWGLADPDVQSPPAQASRGTALARLVDADWDTLRPSPFGHGAANVRHAQAIIACGDEQVVRVVDALRTELLHTLHSEGWNRIAICAPTSGCGATFTAAQLALSLARIPGCRTLLMDLNQRRPGLARLLGLRSPGDIRALLSGRVEAREHLLRLSPTLAVGLTDARASDASEVLHSRRTAVQLDAMINALQPDAVLYDLPPMLEHDDLTAFLPQVDGVLLVADARQTLAGQLSECEARLRGRTKLLGVILNRTRATTEFADAA